MISIKALLGATIFGATLALVQGLLPLPSEFMCCLAFALYPLCGAAYTFLCPRRTRRILTVAIGGAIVAIAALLFQLALAAVKSPIDPIASFREGLATAPPPYQDNTVLIGFGLLMGFSIVAGSVAVMGAAGAAGLNAALSQRDGGSP